MTHPTPVAIVHSEEIEPAYSFYLAGTAHEALQEHLPADLQDEASALHVGTLALSTDPPGAEVAAFAEREAQNRVFMLDPNIRPTLIGDRSASLDRLDRLMPFADLVKLSDSDLAWLYPDVDPIELVDRLLDIGAGCVVVTLGREGAKAWTATASARVQAPEVTVVDTVGAEDAFGAGLLSWLGRHDQLSKRRLRGLGPVELEAALAYAAAAGAAQCTRASAWAPTAADVEAVMNGARLQPIDRRRRTSGDARVR